jgi:hypothetical protein
MEILKHALPMVCAHDSARVTHLSKFSAVARLASDHFDFSLQSRKKYNRYNILHACAQNVVPVCIKGMRTYGSMLL